MQKGIFVDSPQRQRAYCSGFEIGLSAGFTPKDTTFTQRADEFRREFDKLLTEVVSLSNGIVSPGVLQPGEVITPYVNLVVNIVEQNLNH